MTFGLSSIPFEFLLRCHRHRTLNTVLSETDPPPPPSKTEDPPRAGTWFAQGRVAGSLRQCLALFSSQNTWWMRIVVLPSVRCSLQVQRFCLRNVFKNLLSHIQYTFLSVSLFLLASELLRFRGIISVASITINVSVMFPRLQPSLASSSPSNLVALFSQALKETPTHGILEGNIKKKKKYQSHWGVIDLDSAR